MKHFTLLKTWLAMCLLFVGVEASRAEVAELTSADFTSWDASCNTYSELEWTSNNCSFAYASNYNRNWAYVRMGGKGTGGTSYIKFNKQVTSPVSKLIISHKGISGSMTVNWVSVNVYSDADFTNQVDQVKLTSGFTYTTEGTIEFTPSSGMWPADSYYKFSVNWSVTGSSNQGLNVTRMSILGEDDGSGGNNEEPNDPTPASTYTLNISQPAEGGTLTVKNGETPIADGSSVEFGTKLTCEVTNIPEGKRFSRFYVTYDSDNKYKATNPATFDNIPTEGITSATVTVNYQDLPQYTVSWSVNGTVKKTETVYEGTPVSAPDINVCGNKVLYGWATTEKVDSETPELVTPSVTATQSATYYAVFATEISAANETTATFDAIGKSNSGYKEDTKEDDKGNTWSYYASVNLLEGTSYFGLNSNENNYNIASPDFGMNITRIQIKGHNGSSSQDRKLMLCTNNSKAQPSEGDIANITIAKSEKFATIFEVDLSKKTISKFYIYAAAALGVSEVKVTYGTPAVYSDYTTTLDESTLSVKAGKYGTFVAPCDVTLPTGISALSANVDGNSVKFTEIVKGGGVLEANNPVILKNSTGENIAETYYGPATSETTIEKNGLVGFYVSGLTIPINSYVMQTADGVQAFHIVNTEFTGTKNRCYLPATSGAKVLNITLDETAIENILSEEANKGMYDLSGRKVSKAQKGIYIVNGRKLLAK